MPNRKEVKLCLGKRKDSGLRKSKCVISTGAYDNSLSDYRREKAEHDHLEDMRYANSSLRGDME